ncbi:response regulator transcription factor [Sphingomonas sp. RP10(2022)]|uniref:Response regulator transcription factor n=1 Tax=Sphingomonas liriopis TaxID=2949094 RepID=A0A9X2HUE9_9SPHN|nr:response regulator transcription factor [Sphingomonas liriopis]MCP3736087.1 response regulator transcription factor [Sphingomonas liriopis]
MKILLVDDDPVFAAALVEELTGFGHALAVAEDGRAGLAAIDQDAYDAVVLDRMMPRVDGIALLERLRGDARSIPVIMLSARGQSDDKIAGLAAGADDYVVKPVEAAELHARLQAVLRGRQWTQGSSDTLRAGDIVVSPSRFRAWRDDQPLDLAKLELKLLAELVRGAGTVLTRAMLIERVWGYDFEPDTNLVDVYIRRLRQKLTAAGGDDPIRTMRGVGYMLRG